MQFANWALDLAIKVVLLGSAVLYIERRLTRLETQMNELLSWKRGRCAGPFNPVDG